MAGKVTEIQYNVPMDRSGFEVFSNYESALRQGGFKILYSCQDKACGKGAKMASKYLSKGTWIAGEGGLLSAKLTRPDGDVYAVIAVSGKHHKTAITVIEAKPMETGMVKVDADALLNDIERTGHASIYGIYFDTNKAEVKPESKQALGEIAKLLKNKPGLKLHVVGHTDNVGTLDYNMDLSRRRARAVVNVLVSGYGIDAGRLHAAGVGPRAPVLANSSDAGRAKNRRVELVAR
ncbi:MAG: OmpA family protein [Mariprofundaceae bacterium]|nr:OmpA family protein [Mariprofundaceae bacterium]